MSDDDGDAVTWRDIQMVRESLAERWRALYDLMIEKEKSRDLALEKAEAVQHAKFEQLKWTIGIIVLVISLAVNAASVYFQVHK